jgi:hypothetical protein
LKEVSLNNIAICTISSVNYYPFGKTLLQSVATQHPECDLFYLFADKDAKEIPAENRFSILTLDELQIPNIEQMTFVYEITELNTAVKPFLLSFLLNKGYKKVIYLDPDIYVYGRLDVALNALDTYAIALTPHALHPSQAPKSFLDKVQWEQNMTYGGIFNLGFIGISNTLETVEFLAWWKDRCRYLCFIEPNTGIFVDQKWAELAIVFWENVYIVRDPGYNVSIWNLHERTLSGHLINEKQKLIFYHFSSIDINNTEIFSRHDKNYDLSRNPELLSIFAVYRKAVIENGYSRYSSIPYSFNYFADGPKIDLLERRLYAMVAEQYPHPFESDRKTFYRNIKRYARQVNFKPHVQQIPLLMKFAPLLFNIIGPEKYRKLATLFTKAALLRAHTFILKKYHSNN